MKIRDILRHKGHDVVTASTGDSILQAVRVLVDHNIGGVVVVEGGEVIGILTERDILRLVASKPDELQALEVGQVMTRNVIKLTTIWLTSWRRWPGSHDRDRKAVLKAARRRSGSRHGGHDGKQDSTPSRHRGR